MSFNRGIKRNSFGNNRGPFNRGSGGGGNVGMGGGMGGSGVGSAGNRGVSPWESGVMPPGRGILPTPNNNLSLNSPQAQLVIASNLLSNLLRTQQDPSPPVPPSLLSLGNTMNGPGPNFRGQQGFSPPGRFNDRQSRAGNLKNQRSQPYNKMGNRARDGRRGPSSASRSQSGNQRANGNQNQHRNDKNSKANAKNQTSKKEQQDVKNSKEKLNTETVAKSTEKADEKDDEKVEVKTEKDNETPMETSETETATEGKKDAKKDSKKDSKSDKSGSPEKKKDEGSGKRSETRHAESRYAAVAMNKMHCHVCNKDMWDGSSFENHLRGRAHQLMMDKLDESYKLKVDLMRHELRVSEEQRAMSLSNSKRRGKKLSVDFNTREYCTMCDLHFIGTLASHRKSDKHQQLKTFLHPRCGPCSKEFPSRIEYDEHCLTPTHMVAAAQEEQKKTKKVKLNKGESEVRTAKDEEDEIGAAKISDKDEEIDEEKDYLTDITEGMDTTKLPTFKYARSKQLALGASLVKEVTGFHCDKCKRFMLTQEDVNSHLKTMVHYRNFFNEVKALNPPKKAAVSEEASVKKEEESAPTEDGEREAKRPKLEEDAQEDAEKSSQEEKPSEEQEAAEENEKEGGDENEKEDGDDKYDPMEAEEESEGEKDETKKDEEEDDSKKDDDKAADVWGDIDNEDESEVGNLIDGDEKTDEQTESVPQTPQKAQPQNASTPAASAPEVTPSTPATPATPTPPEPPIISKQSTPTNSTPSTPSTPNNSLNNSANNSANKNNSARGRGFRGGPRGHQRARRSRR